jgi:hypothetical protein
MMRTPIVRTVLAATAIPAHANADQFAAGVEANAVH